MATETRAPLSGSEPCKQGTDPKPGQQHMRQHHRHRLPLPRVRDSHYLCVLLMESSNKSFEMMFLYNVFY